MVERGLASSREKAKALIMAGIVYVNQNKEDKAGASFDPEETEIEVRGATLRYVSRGGLKLEKALKVFPIDLTGRVCMDMRRADVTDIPGVGLDDEVVLLGSQGEERITPDELAELAETIPYEIMLGFLSRVPRVVECE